MFDGIGESPPDCDILSPQIREMYQALMQAGNITEALNLAREHSAAEHNPDYLSAKRKTVYNLWIYSIAKALEDQTCNKGEMPCNLCLDQARKIGGILWVKISQFLKDLGPHHWGTPWELLQLLQKVLEAKPPLITPPPTQERTLRIVKAPTPEARYAASNDSA